MTAGKSMRTALKNVAHWLGVDCNCFLWLGYECPRGGMRDGLAKLRK